MDQFDPTMLQPVGGLLMLGLLFVLRELVSGALKEAGKEVWIWLRGRTAGEPAVETAACDRSDDDRSLRRPPLRRRDGRVVTMLRLPARRKSAGDSQRKSA